MDGPSTDASPGAAVGSSEEVAAGLVAEARLRLELTRRMAAAGAPQAPIRKTPLYVRTATTLRRVPVPPQQVELGGAAYAVSKGGIALQRAGAGSSRTP